MHYAAWYCRERIAQFLLSFDIDPNQSGTVGDRPLHIACLRGNLRIATLLVEKGADVNLSDDEHHTPLHICCQVMPFNGLKKVLY